MLLEQPICTGIGVHLKLFANFEFGCPLTLHRSPARTCGDISYGNLEPGDVQSQLV